tara:strand:- start:12675 stop:14795 length:2121 start_codon:yes stop_codon:yes gene_type:complete
MAINYEIKSQLAKLLATEDLVVENQPVETASFDVERRILTLPLWKKASEKVYDLLVGHEVGHALYTPNEWGFEKEVPSSIVNVTEDARVEKLMKRRYPGLSKSFYQGYSELADQDFFSIEETGVEDMNLADRINLHFKIGKFVDIPFSLEEYEYVELTEKAETFDDAVEVAKKIYQYCKDSQPSQKEKQEIDIPQSGSQGSTGDGGESIQTTQDETSPSGETDESGEQSDTNESNSEDSKESDDTLNDKIEALTDKLFNEGVEELADTNGRESQTHYFQPPKLNMDRVIIPNSKIHQIVDDYKKRVLESEHISSDCYDRVDKMFREFKKTANSEVNYMVKEFECKKSADAYSRSSVSKSGVLDCSKLHTYKYNEDLFKKVTVIPDGKNHGLIFILDWSGSMCEILMPTIKQLFKLIWFCNKVSIPFDVYAFTNSFVDSDPKFVDEYGRLKDTIVNKEDDLFIDNSFSMMNLLTSDVNRKELDSQMLNLFEIVYSIRNYTEYNYPNALALSGTPLNETLITLTEVIPEFKKNNNVQKVQCVILTDGEAGPINACRFIHTEFNSYWGTRKVFHNDYFRNRKTGKTYKYDYSFSRHTEIYLNNLKDMFPETNFIGIRVGNSRDLTSFIKRHVNFNDDCVKKFKKEKYFNILSAGYDAYFAMIDSALENNTDFVIEEGATKAKIKSAFMKNLKSKKLNKKVLGEFVELVA